jgi:hypothetical protein
VYPNPTKEIVVISTKDMGEIEIINSLGVILQKIPINNSGHMIDLSNYSSGRYLIRFTDKNMISTTVPIIKE